MNYLETSVKSVSRTYLAIGRFCSAIPGYVLIFPTRVSFSSVVFPISIFKFATTLPRVLSGFKKLLYGQVTLDVI